MNSNPTSLNITYKVNISHLPFTLPSKTNNKHKLSLAPSEFLEATKHKIKIPPSCVLCLNTFC